MINNLRKNMSDATIIDCNGTTKIFIWPETLFTATIRVQVDLTAIWQKTNCTYLDLATAVAIAERGEQTGIFEH